MIGVRAVVTRDGITAGLLRVAASARDKRPLFERAGKYMVATEIPRIFREGGPHGAWAPPKMRRGKPLRDTGRLLASVAWRATDSDAIIGTPLRYAPIQHRGGTVVPKAGKKWLVIPLCPPLSQSQRQTMGPRDFPGAFFLRWGPEGPGIYRKSRRVIASSVVSGGASKYARASRGIERIFAAVKSVKIPARPFLVWTPRAVKEIGALWQAVLARAAR